MNFLYLFNQVARVARPAHLDFTPLESLEQQIKETELDSLDTMVLCMYMAELYGISEETSKDMLPETPQQLLDFLVIHKTKEPESVEQAMAEVL